MENIKNEIGNEEWKERKEKRKIKRKRNEGEKKRRRRKGIKSRKKGIITTEIESKIEKER